MLATRPRTIEALVALILAITTSLAVIGPDLHIELEGCSGSADDYLIFEGGSSMVGSSVSLSARGLVALLSREAGDQPFRSLVEILNDTYSGREDDGVQNVVPHPG